MKRALLKTAIYILAFVGAMVVLFFVLHSVGVFNVKGKVDEKSSLFSLTSSQVKRVASSVDEQYSSVETSGDKELSLRELTCQIDYLSERYPASANRIYTTLQSTSNLKLVQHMLFATSTSDQNLLIGYNDCAFKKSKVSDTNFNPDAYAWMNSDEWRVLKTALTKDQAVINSVAKKMNMSPRIFLGPIIGEQLRFYTSARATFKSYLMPNNSFIYLSSFSHGIAGLKPETCELIEKRLKDRTSVWYAGEQYENLLDYPATISEADIPAERLRRISDRSDHSWAYLYAALYLKQFEAQWHASGVEIGDRPDILATLYNLGHNRSIPKPNPATGGAPITINGTTYTFGGLAYDFYWSGELQELFPY